VAIGEARDQLASALEAVAAHEPEVVVGLRDDVARAVDEDPLARVLGDERRPLVPAKAAEGAAVVGDHERVRIVGPRRDEA
jgi:hypothetical protein